MTPHVEKRYHPRVRVQWPTVFFTRQGVGYGTVVDVSCLAWRIRGSLPVHAGMELAVLVRPPHSAYLMIEEATVLWARDQEFALEIYQVRAEDERAMDALQQRTMGRSHLPSDFGRSSSRRGRSAFRRPARRTLAQCHVRYRQADGQQVIQEEGVLEDLSILGCQFLSRAALHPGQLITLILYFNDGRPPISLPGTSVRWAGDHRFGVSFPDTTSEERKQLQEFVRNDSTMGLLCRVSRSQKGSADGRTRPMALGMVINSWTWAVAAWKSDSCAWWRTSVSSWLNGRILLSRRETADPPDGVGADKEVLQ